MISGSINSIKLKGPFSLFKKIRDRDVSLEMAEEDQEKFKRQFSQIKSRNPKHKYKMQLYIIRNVKNLYDLRQKIIDLCNNYSKIKSEIYLSIKTRKKDLKYSHLNKCFKDYQQLLQVIIQKVY